MPSKCTIIGSIIALVSVLKELFKFERVLIVGAYIFFSTYCNCKVPLTTLADNILKLYVKKKNDMCHIKSSPTCFPMMALQLSPGNNIYICFFVFVENKA